MRWADFGPEQPIDTQKQGRPREVSQRSINVLIVQGVEHGLSDALRQILYPFIGGVHGK
jgi:hypothetical protein